MKIKCGTMRETVRSVEPTKPMEACLKHLCLCAVSKHLASLDVDAVLGLPKCLIKDLLPHLTVCQLDELQPGLNQRGISTLPGWAGVLQDMCGPNYAVDLHTEDEAKCEVMRMLFMLVFYGFSNPFVKRNITHLNTPSFLLAAAKCINHFILPANLQGPINSLTAEQPMLLNLLEKQIMSIGVLQSIDLSKRKAQTPLYILHRLLDHGVANKVVIRAQSSIFLAWLLHRRGSQYVNLKLKGLMHRVNESCISPTASVCAEGASVRAGIEAVAAEDLDDEVPSRKRCKLDPLSDQEEPRKAHFTVDPQALCQVFCPHDGPSTGVCPRGQIDFLEVRQCDSDSLIVLNSALPTFFCLRSLTLHSLSTFRDSDVLGIAKALKQLYESSHSSLTNLQIGILPHIKFVETLLNANPKVTSLNVEIQTVMWGLHFSQHQFRTADADVSELPLEKLTIKVAELQTDLHFITSVLRRSPHLTSLHIAGLRLPSGSSLSQLLITLSESNRHLKRLSLEDLKLSDCLPELLSLLRDCKLEELQCNDCRLLEKCSDKKATLQQLVAAVKMVPSLHTLSLAQNRLAKNVCVLAELFSGSLPSSVIRLDISSNFIQPADLLEFAERLTIHRPPHRLTLDLRQNPGDRDSDTWNTALNSLRPFCVLRFERWKSTDTLVDHISNM